MKYRKLMIILIATIPALLTFYNSCGNVKFAESHISVMGNPMTPTQATQEILFAICSVLDRCQSQVPFNVCMSEVLTTNGIGSQLGLPPGVSDPYSALENAEKSGAISANPTATNNCVDTINNLSCSNPDVINAYNPANTNPLAAVFQMVPMQSCGQVFTSPTQYSCTTKVFLRGASNVSNGPAAPGANLIYSVSPALPAGLSINTATGVISGTPTVITALTAYTVTATSPAGASTNTVNLRTADGYLVNDLGDSDDATPGDGICLTSAGTCTLRAAINESNNDGSSQVIVLPPGKITLGGTELVINKAMDVYGDCALQTTIDGNNLSRVIHANGNPATLSNLILQNGNVTMSGGGGLWVATPSTVTLNNSVIQNNYYSGGGGFGGGGIQVNGTLNMQNTVIQNNTSPSPGAGLSVWLNATSTILNSAFINNTSSSGGALFLIGQAIISNSLFQNNSATGGAGGAVYCADVAATGNFINDTFYGNKAPSGGAIALGNGGAVTLSNSTISGNRATGTGAGGLDSYVGGTITIGNSIVAGNFNGGTLYNCNMKTSLTSGGYNLSDNADCTFGAGGDLLNTKPQLGPLQNNGGATETLGLLPGSPAIGHIMNSSCPSIDQRGYPRPFQGCDVGAYEFQ